MDTTLEGADNVFAGNSNRQVSAHFGVEEETIHQYVKLTDTAWHSGNWMANLTSVGIEHSAAPGRPASEVTYNTSAELICNICTQLGLVPSRALLHKHSEFNSTSCPGTIDLDHLAELAIAKWQAKSTPTVVLATAAVTPQVRFAPFVTDLSPSQTYSDEVKRVQEFLIWQKCLNISSGFGHYGPKTAAGINNLKGKYSHPDNGMWDYIARGIANGIIAEQSPTSNLSA